MSNARSVLIGLGIVGASIVVAANLLKKPMTYDEYLAYIHVLNYEIGKAGGSISIRPAGRHPIKAIEEDVLTRPVTEQSVTLDGETMTPDQYRSLREALIKKRR